MGSSPLALDASRILDKLSVPHTLIFKSWEPCSFLKVPDCPQTYDS